MVMGLNISKAHAPKNVVAMLHYRKQNFARMTKALNDNG